MGALAGANVLRGGQHAQMGLNDVYCWLAQSGRRKEVLANLNQPLTAKQLSQRLGITTDSCSFLFWQLSVYELLYCLNPEARTNRLHWVTAVGNTCQRKLREALHLPQLLHRFPNIKWKLYGQVCFSHRSAVIRALAKPMRPAAIKRNAKSQDPNLRMSANNVRDVIRILLDYGVVRPVWTEKKAHPDYDLVGEGSQFRELLLRAELLPRHAYRSFRPSIASHVNDLDLVAG